jgi:hypothetical protein
MKKTVRPFIWFLPVLIFAIIASSNVIAGKPKITYQLNVLNQASKLGKVSTKVGPLYSGRLASIKIKPRKNYYATIVLDGHVVKTGRPGKPLKYKIKMRSDHKVKVYFTLVGSPFVLPIGAVSLSWSAPEYRDNGDELFFADIRGYEIHYISTDEKISGTVEIDGAETTSAVVKVPQAGSYYFSIATVDINGEKSLMSDPVEIVID